MEHGDAREGKWRGHWRMEWVASTLTPPPNVVYPALLKLMRTPRLLAVDWTDAPTDLNGLVRFEERRNLVSARVPSRSAIAIQQIQEVNYSSETAVWESVEFNIALNCTFYTSVLLIFVWLRVWIETCTLYWLRGIGKETVFCWVVWFCTSSYIKSSPLFWWYIATNNERMCRDTEFSLNTITDIQQPSGSQDSLRTSLDVLGDILRTVSPKLITVP